MKNAPLILSEIKLIPQELLRNGMQENELFYVSESVEPIYYTPGSGLFESEKKENTSGIYYENSIRYSIPSLLSKEENKSFDKIGAVVVKTENGRRIIFYQNDYHSNTPLRFSISSGFDKTIVKTSIITIYPL